MKLQIFTWLCYLIYLSATKQRYFFHFYQVIVTDETKEKKTTFDIYLKFIENKKFIRDSNKTFVSPMFEVYKREVLIF